MYPTEDTNEPNEQPAAVAPPSCRPDHVEYTPTAQSAVLWAVGGDATYNGHFLHPPLVQSFSQSSLEKLLVHADGRTALLSRGDHCLLDQPFQRELVARHLTWELSADDVSGGFVLFPMCSLLGTTRRAPVTSSCGMRYCNRDRYKGHIQSVLGDFSKWRPRNYLGYFSSDYLHLHPHPSLRTTAISVVKAHAEIDMRVGSNNQASLFLSGAGTGGENLTP